MNTQPPASTKFRSSPTAGSLCARGALLARDARALAAEIVKPGVEAVTMVKSDIDPWLSFPALPEVYLAGRAGETPAASPPAPQLAASEAERAWERTRDTTSIALLETFIDRYKDTYYADIARARVEDLKKQHIAMATPPARRRRAQVQR
jgi:hypothetical protein